MDKNDKQTPPFRVNNPEICVCCGKTLGDAELGKQFCNDCEDAYRRGTFSLEICGNMEC